MSNTLFVTAIYNNLYGTEFGGRERIDHYNHSLLSLLKMTDADFVCYTSKSDLPQLERFFYTENGISNTKLRFVEFELTDIPFYRLIQKLKNSELMKTSDRCYEIQYAKFHWLKLESGHGWHYTRIYWIDAGLSHIGIIPPKHLEQGETWGSKYFYSPLFNNKMLRNLNIRTRHQLYVIGKDNTEMHYTAPSIPNTYFYRGYENKIHIIGGLFGGRWDLVLDYCEHFYLLLFQLLNKEDSLYYEEQIMTAIYYREPSWFTPDFFQTWWHEESNIQGVDADFFTKYISFYKVLEELQCR
jgi:hypothetical protein